MSFVTVDDRVSLTTDQLASILNARISVNRSSASFPAAPVDGSKRLFVGIATIIGILLLCAGLALIFTPDTTVAGYLVSGSDLRSTCSVERDCYIAAPNPVPFDEFAGLVRQSRDALVRTEPATAGERDDVTGSIATSFGALVVPRSRWSSPAVATPEKDASALGSLSRRLSLAMANASSQPSPSAKPSRPRKLAAAAKPSPVRRP